MFVENIKNQLGAKAAHRDVVEADESHALHERTDDYAARFAGKNEARSSENSIL